MQITGYKQWSAHAQCRPTALGFYVWLQIMFCKCVKQTMLFSFFSFFSDSVPFFSNKRRHHDITPIGKDH